MLNNSWERRSLLDQIENDLIVMKKCLEIYKDTKDERFVEWAKEFGQWSKKHKAQLEKLK